MSRLLIPLVAVLSFVSAAPAENWPMWRGPRGDGTSLDKGFPTKWDAASGANIAWTCEIPGKGHSSPIVWNDRVFLTTCLEDPDPKKPQDRVLICIDRKSGKIAWRKTVLTAPKEPVHKLNSFASSTPATDGTHVFVTFHQNPNVVVAAYDFQGNEVWRKVPGEFQSQHGFCSPPVIYKSLVIVNCDQDAFGKKKPAYVVALDRATGDEKWRIDRPERIRSYCPPLIAEAAGRTQMVMTGAWAVDSYDPDTGKPIWHIHGPTEQFVASMIYHKGLFFLTAGFPTYHVMAIKPDGAGDVTKTHEVWHEEKGAGYVPSPVAAGDNIFLVHDNGLASARDARTGKLHWFERLGKHHSASPVAAEGKVFYADDDGATFVVTASEKFDVVEKNKINETVYASPAFSDGQIFLRGEKRLFCIAPKK